MNSVDDEASFEKFEEMLDHLEFVMDTAISKAETASSMSLADIYGQLK